MRWGTIAVLSQGALDADPSAPQPLRPSRVAASATLRANACADGIHHEEPLPEEVLHESRTIVSSGSVDRRRRERPHHGERDGSRAHAGTAEPSARSRSDASADPQSGADTEPRPLSHAGPASRAKSDAGAEPISEPASVGDSVRVSASVVAVRAGFGTRALPGVRHARLSSAPSNTGELALLRDLPLLTEAARARPCIDERGVRAGNEEATARVFA